MSDDLDTRVGAYMRERMPDVYSLVAWSAEHDPVTGPPVDYQPMSPAGVHFLQVGRERARGLLDLTTFGPCPTCFAPVYRLPTGWLRDYPTMVRHLCGELDAPALEKQEPGQPTKGRKAGKALVG